MNGPDITVGEIDAGRENHFRENEETAAVAYLELAASRPELSLELESLLRQMDGAPLYIYRLGSFVAAVFPVDMFAPATVTDLNRDFEDNDLQPS